MKTANAKEVGTSVDAAYLADFTSWRTWIGQSFLDIDEGACYAAAHAAVLTSKLGAIDSADSVAGAQAAMALAEGVRDGVAVVDPAQPDGALLALRRLLASGWRPNLQSGYSMQLVEGEHVHAISPCTAFYWGTRQVTTWTAGGLSLIGLILALITIPIAMARQAEARKDAWRPLSNSTGTLVITDKRLLRIGSDKKLSSIPYPALRSVAFHDKEGGLEIDLNDKRFLYRVQPRQLILELLSTLQNTRDGSPVIDAAGAPAQVGESR